MQFNNNNCLCQNITNLEEYKKFFWWDRERGIRIVYDDINDEYGLWYECDDTYYSDWELTINYCPICGRRLNANK